MSNTKQNTPFYEGGDYKYNAVLSWGLPTWYNHIEGFYQAAHHIATNMLSHGNDTIPIDSGVFPMIFLYRHYIELSLKAQLWKMYDARRLYGQKWSAKKLDEVLQNHSLSPLCKKFESALFSMWEKTLSEKIYQRYKKETQQSLKLLNKVCIDLDELDNGSLGCRYPINNEWKSYYTGNDHINIVLFVDAMQKVRVFLTGADDELEAALEAMWSQQT